jgi:cytochrome c
MPARLPCIAMTALATFLASASYAASDPKDVGYYTPRQAEAGEQVYRNQCMQCHGPDLRGQSGPALAGATFKSRLEFSRMSASQLFDFIASQMPYNKPGSLSHQQYLDVLAYILKRNGYPGRNQPLTEARLKQIKLLPYPTKQAKHARSSAAQDD